MTRVRLVYSLCSGNPHQTRPSCSGTYNAFWSEACQRYTIIFKSSLSKHAVCLKLLQNFAKPRKTQLQPEQKDVSILLLDCVDSTGEHSLTVAPAAQKSWLTRRNESTLDMAKDKPPQLMYLKPWLCAFTKEQH